MSSPDVTPIRSPSGCAPIPEEIICRDRASAYADGARSGAPKAVQVADRWHVWHNLGEAVDKTVAAHHACLRASLTMTAPIVLDAEGADAGEAVEAVPQVGVDGGDQVGMRDVRGRERTLVTRTRHRYADVQQHLADGASLEAICRATGLDRGTVRRYARAGGIDELLVKAINRTSVIDGYAEQLLVAYTAGTTDAVILHRQIRDLGFTGSVQTVRRFLRPLRPAAESTASRPATVSARPAVPKPRHIVRWIMTEDGRLTDEQRRQLNRVLAACPHLSALAGHVRGFAHMMANRDGQRLDRWMAAVDNHDLPALHSLTTGLRRDHAAVTAGLTLTWSSGPVEGAVNRIKTIKRQMYGRASLALLRKRILHPA